jgi:hypothetical protein
MAGAHDVGEELPIELRAAEPQMQVLRYSGPIFQRPQESIDAHAPPEKQAVRSIPSSCSRQWSLAHPFFESRSAHAAIARTVICIEGTPIISAVPARRRDWAGIFVHDGPFRAAETGLPDISCATAPGI